MRRLLVEIVDATGDETPSVRAFAVATAAGIAAVAVLVFSGLDRTDFRVAMPVTELSIPGAVVAFAVAFVVVLVLTATLGRIDSAPLFDRWRRISLWGRALVVGFVCALVLTAVLVVSLPAASPRLTLGLAVFPSAWSLSTAGFVLQARRWTGTERSRLHTTLVEAGYAQLRGLERRTLAVFTGGTVAVLGATVTALLSRHYAGRTHTLAVVTTGILLWIAGAVLTYDRYGENVESRELSVLGIRESTSARTREMTIRNDADRGVELADGTVRDTEHECYRVGGDRRLGPGETCTLTVPESFALAPEDAAVDLPLGYTLSRGSDVPVVFGPEGDRFPLRPVSRDIAQEGTNSA